MARSSRKGASGSYIRALVCILLLAAIPVVHYQLVMHPSDSAKAMDGQPIRDIHISGHVADHAGLVQAPPRTLAETTPKLVTSATFQGRPLNRPGLELATESKNRTQHITLPAVIPQKDAHPAVEPDLSGLVSIINRALVVYQQSYRSGQGDALSPDCDKGFAPPHENVFLPGCPASGCRGFPTLDEAKAECKNTPDCGGVTKTEPSNYELRKSGNGQPSTSRETSWTRETCFKRSSAASVWHTFAHAMEDALQNTSLHLDAEFPVRDDDSLFISISAYRDHSCRASVRKAYERASRPELLSVGVVQQNCYRNCQQGQGWANTRRLVPSGPDPDCITEFCSSKLGKPHCEAGRVRILRIGEAEALGPLFARYLNAKLWKGENYFMQIDSHTDFRKDWDSTLIKMIKLTPSFPNSVISNYPPSGTAESSNDWGVAHGREHSKGGLCGCTFERIAGNTGGYTVRLAQSGSHAGGNGVDQPPPYTGFIAAGFFFAHGSIVPMVPPDPFLPYIFMGEEIAITLRTWTAGFDIYAPSVDVVSHEYVRSHSIKFWESVGIVFDNGGLHNALTTLIIPRIQHLVGFPEALRPEQVKPADLLTHMDEFNVGTVRTREAFLEMMQIDLKKKSQSAPKWCRQGLAPPLARKKSQ